MYCLLRGCVLDNPKLTFSAQVSKYKFRNTNEPCAFDSLLRGALQLAIISISYL